MLDLLSLNTLNIKPGEIGTKQCGGPEKLKTWSIVCELVTKQQGGTEKLTPSLLCI